MLLSAERPVVGAFAFHIPRAMLLHFIWSGASSPAGVGLEHRKRIIEIPQELGRSCHLLGEPRLEIPGYQLQASTVHSSVGERMIE